jgi:2-polyprenyl-6-methoxyphenol hydroxylase-like FAD-dependent oxidoreductase
MESVAGHPQTPPPMGSVAGHPQTPAPGAPQSPASFGTPPQMATPSPGYQPPPAMTPHPGGRTIPVGAPSHAAPPSHVPAHVTPPQFSMTRSRYSLQCSLADDIDAWPDERFWDELRHRLDDEANAKLVIGPSIEKSIAPLRSFVAEPMRFGRLFLAGDAAHIVPPTGAKGLNLAASDVRYLSLALIEHYKEKSDAGIEHYSSRALARVWQAERFSWWMTTLLHTFPDANGFDNKVHRAELDYIFKSQVAATALAENYVGLPL